MQMSVHLQIDDRDITRIMAGLAAMRSDVRHRVAARALRRVASAGTSLIAKDIAALTQIQQKHVRARLKTYYDTGDLSLDTKVSSGFIPLIELGGKRMQAALRKVKGSHRTAFIAAIKKDKAVFRRVGTSRGPVKEQFGPNPAHAVQEHPDRYQDLLGQAIDRLLVPRLLHEIDFALGKLGR
jgi:hypothetical protein